MKIVLKPRRICRFIAWTVLLLPIYKGYIGESLILESLYDLGRYISIFACMLISIKYFNMLFKERALMMLFFAKFYIAVLTVTMGVKNNDCLYSFILVVMQGILFTYMLQKEPKIAFHVFSFVFEVMVFINLITLILHPNGLYNFEAERIYTFLGHANNTIYYTLPLATLAIISWLHGISKIRSIVDLTACIASTILVKSATGVVVFMCFILIIIWKRNTTKISYFTVYLFVVLISCGFIFFNIQSVFGFIIETVLNRQLNFTGRTYYWNKTIVEIKKNPIIGHGAVPGGLRPGGLSAHNYFLETLYEGGILLFGFFSLLFHKISQKLDKYKNLQAAKILLSAMASITLTCISESNISNDIFFVLFIWGTQVEHFDKINAMHKSYGRI